MPYSGGGGQSQRGEDGPEVKVQEKNPGISVRVTSTYRATGKRLWSGMVTIAFLGEDLLEIEGSVQPGRDGEPWFAGASREYEDASGQTKYKNMIWLSSKNLSGACTEAVLRSIGQWSEDGADAGPPLADAGPPLDDADLPL